ncbi:MAG: DUF4340 domain-containing protein [Spirochaetia bacterium]|nr:DUF4340 domain-containing protein [Spirochaetota bacterium]MCX8096636.1 DUF4340 domain-containing protein [Spirochaetota bacterium]MDW8112083.1 DUF4340 domain-containing protein [Spirochaetia bacterium]
MRGKTVLILILLGILVVLLVFFFIFERGEVKVVKKKEFILGEFTSQDISFISIYFRDYYDRTKEYNYTLFKKAGNEYWFISYSNITDRVDPKLGNFIANILGDIEELGRISSNEVDDIYLNFGFDKPNARVQFDIKGKTNTLTVGNLAPTKDYYYTVLNDDYSQIYLVYAYKIDNILKYPDEARDKNIFTYEWTNVTGIEYKPMSYPVMVFTNINNRWLSKVPVEKELDSTFIETEFLKDLRSISISSFIPPDSRMYRDLVIKSNSPLAYIKFYNGKNELTLFVLSKASTNFYCYDTDRKLVYSIDYESTRVLFDSSYERFVKITN